MFYKSNFVYTCVYQGQNIVDSVYKATWWGIQRQKIGVCFLEVAAGKEGNDRIN